MTDQLLDLPDGIGVVTYDFRFDVVNDQLNTIGSVNPVRDRQAVQLQNFTESEIKRTLRNFVLRPDQYRDLDPYRDRIRPVMQLGDGRTFPLGVFSYPQIDEAIRKGGGDVTATLYDSGMRIRPPSDRVWSLAVGDLVTDVLGAFIASRGVARVAITPSTARVSTPVAFPIGTSGSQIVARLADLLGYYSPYFDRTDTFVARPVEALNYADALKYPLETSRLIRGSITRTQQIGEAPNVFIVLNAGATGGEVVGRFEVPAEAPHSVANRGYVVPEITRLQGIESTDAAVQAAFARSVQSPGDVGRFQFSTPVDPRHETFDAVAVGTAALYYEIGWSSDLSPGGTMTHNVRKVYK